jgi:hypothetical protein
MNGNREILAEEDNGRKAKTAIASYWNESSLDPALVLGTLRLSGGLSARRSLLCCLDLHVQQADPGRTSVHGTDGRSQIEPGKRSNRLASTTIGWTTKTYHGRDDY